MTTDHRNYVRNFERIPIHFAQSVAAMLSVYASIPEDSAQFALSHLFLYLFRQSLVVHDEVVAQRFGHPRLVPDADLHRMVPRPPAQSWATDMMYFAPFPTRLIKAEASSMESLGLWRRRWRCFGWREVNLNIHVHIRFFVCVGLTGIGKALGGSTDPMM